MTADTLAPGTTPPLPPLVRPRVLAERLPGLIPDAETAYTVAAGVSAAVRRYAGWHIAPVVTETMILDGHGSRDLLLPTMRIVDVAECVVMTGPGQSRHLDPATLEWSMAGIIRHPSGWPDRFRCVRLTLTHGWDLDDVADVTDACIDLAHARLANPLGFTSQTIGPASWTQGSPSAGVSSLEASKRERLRPFRIEARP